MPQPDDRPLGVTLIALLLALNGFVAFFGAIGALGFADDGWSSVILGIAFALALQYLAYGMWTLQSWAWLTTLFVEGINAIFALYALFTSSDAVGVWFSLILAVAIIFYLTRPAVRHAFGRRPTGV